MTGRPLTVAEVAGETMNWATPATGDPIQDAKRLKAKRSGPTVNRYLAALSACSYC